MKKILVLGSCGAGKSTLAKQLHEITGIEIIHLDQHYWKPKWARTAREEWQKKVTELLRKEQWIMDGNYRSTMDMRLAQADAVIWLDFSPIVCLFRLLKRRLKNNRANELADCRERISFELLKWVLWKFPRENKKDIMERLHSLGSGKDVYILKSNRQILSYLSEMKKKFKNDLDVPKIEP